MSQCEDSCVPVSVIKYFSNLLLVRSLSLQYKIAGMNYYTLWEH